VDPGIQVLAEVVIVLEKAIAVSAIMVLETLSVVLLTRVVASEVTAAIIARPVDTGSPFVLLQGNVAREPYRAAITIRHGMVVVQCEEVEARSQNLCDTNTESCGNAERPANASHTNPKWYIRHIWIDAIDGHHYTVVLRIIKAGFFHATPTVTMSCSFRVFQIWNC
jgi:hypothetical protein